MPRKRNTLISEERTASRDSAVARRRIQRLVASKGTALDLSDLSELGALPSSLANLSTLQSLDAAGTKISDIETVAKLVSLERLNIENTRVSSLEPVRGLRKLRSLSIDSTDISDISALGENVGLIAFYANMSKVANLTPLQGHPSLRYIMLGSCPVTNISPLITVPRLTNVYLADSDLSNIQPLSKVKLRSLGFEGCPVEDTVLREISSIEDGEKCAEVFLRYVNDGIVPDLDEYDKVDTALSQRPSAFKFAWDGRRINAREQKDDPFNKDVALDFIKILREKIEVCRSSLKRNHADDSTLSALENVASLIKGKPESLPIGVLLMKFKTLQAESSSYGGGSDRERSVRVAVSDYTASVEELLALYPLAREIEANRQALRFSADNESANIYASSVSSLMTLARQAKVVDPSAVRALAQSQKEVERLTEIAGTSLSSAKRAEALSKRASLLGLQALDVRNFVSGALQGVGAEFGGLATDSWKEVRRHVPKAIGTTSAKIIATSGRVALAYFVSHIADPVLAAGAVVGSFLPLGRRLGQIARDFSDEAPDSE